MDYVLLIIYDYLFKQQHYLVHNAMYLFIVIFIFYIDTKIIFIIIFNK